MNRIISPRLVRRLAVLLLPAVACTVPPAYDVVIRGGTVYDGSGNAPVSGDVAISGDSIVAIGRISGTGRLEVQAEGLAVAPGFINMLSWATESLIEDGRSQSDIRQGVTLEVMGEGDSMGPLSDTLRADMLSQQGDITFPITWRTLRGYQDSLVKKGISTNIASFIGATTVRINHVGWDDRAPTASELEAMQAEVRTAMEEGALGVGSSLIYAPAFYAKTPELIALMKAAAPYGGMYISHMRSEGARLEDAVEELITIAREAGVRAEIYHLKAAGERNWPKMENVLARIEAVRAEGLEITADIYPYTAGATGLDAAMPPWVQEGGYAAWAKRLQDPATRTKVAQEMRTPTDQWESLLLAAGSPERVVLSGFKADSLKQYTGMTLAYWCGCSNVALSRMVAGSNNTTSAKYPGLSIPRRASRRLPAGSADMRRTASCSVSTCSSRVYLPSTRAKLPYARGCGLLFKNLPSDASEPASDPMLTHGFCNSFTMLSSPMMK